MEQAQDAKASASVNPALFDREQAPDRHIDSGIPCSKRLKLFRNERALRTHNRRSKRLTVNEVAPADPLADQVCRHVPKCVRACAVYVRTRAPARSRPTQCKQLALTWLALLQMAMLK